MAEVVWKDKEFQKELRRQLEIAMFKAVNHLEGRVKRNISGASPPRSAPGEFPHVDSGRLRQSIASEVDVIPGVAVVGRVGTNVEYAPYLEFGTARMAARPFLRPTLRKELRRIRNILIGRRRR